MYKLIVLALTSFSIVACGDDGADVSIKSEKYSYDFTLNGCKTEKQTFESLEAMCKGLQSHSLNHGCAEGMREDYFKKNCSGTFTFTN